MEIMEMLKSAKYAKLIAPKNNIYKHQEISTNTKIDLYC